MHAVGFFHEQSRPDRDEHVTINLGNVVKGYEHNFMKYSLNQANMVGEYDMCSIMHYGAWEGGQYCKCYQKHKKLPSFSKHWGKRERAKRNCTKCQTIGWGELILINFRVNLFQSSQKQKRNDS